MVRKYDYLIIGSGVAGMSFALKVAKTGTVALVCKSKMEEANTDLAQGGVATVTNLEVDNFEKHIHDTMVAGDWLSDPEAVKKVVTEAPAQIQELLGWGVDFDRNEKGEFDLHREGGHSEFRILHHADNTGHEIQVSLGQNRDAPHVGHRVLWCLRPQSGNGRGGYLPVTRDIDGYGWRRLCLSHHDQPAGGNW